MDIHLLESNFKKNGSGFIKTVFHVPNDKTKNNYPGQPVSIVAGLQQVEIDSLANGSLCEVVINVRVNINVTYLQIKNKIRDMWQPIASANQNKLNKNYKVYSVTLNRS